MNVMYFGCGFVKVQAGDMVVAVNPLGKDASPPVPNGTFGRGTKGPRFGSDIVLVSLNDPDYNGVESVSYGEKTPFVINGPGEYEIKGISVKGYKSAGFGGKINTIYSALIEGIHIVHLGALADGGLPADFLESVGEVDILFIPVAGDRTIDSTDAEKVAAALEPKIIIPLYEYPRGGKNSLHDFLDEFGAHEGEPQEKLVLKRKDLDGKEGEIVALMAHH